MSLRTLQELTAFALSTKRGKSFGNYTDEDIIRDIQNAYNLSRIIYSSDAYGNITGIGMYGVYQAEKRIHCNQLLARSTKDMQAIVRTFFSFFPSKDWKLTAERNGKMVEYNTSRLAHKLLNLKTITQSTY
jgi:hypothetical protein